MKIKDLQPNQSVKCQSIDPFFDDATIYNFDTINVTVIHTKTDDNIWNVLHIRKNIVTLFRFNNTPYPVKLFFNQSLLTLLPFTTENIHERE